MKEGYLLMWHESGDEIHIDLIDEETYNKFVNADADSLGDIHYEPIEHFFTQTHTIEPWIFNEYKILGTYCTTSY